MAPYLPFAQRLNGTHLMIKYKKGGVLEFTGKDYTKVLKYAVAHKLTFKDVVYLAIMNGIAAGHFAKKGKHAKKA